MPSHSPNALPLPALGDLDYQVQALLPTGSKMSEILLVTDRQGQTVVFKIACVQQRARAETNRRAIHNSVAWLQQMRDHPGLAQLQPICHRSQTAEGQGEGRVGLTTPTFVATLPDWPGAPDFLITEYLAGGTLDALVGKRPLPVDLALSLTYELAQTLAYLHAHGCVHRDLKPENVLFRTPPPANPIAGELQPVLIDFGIAARVGEPRLISGSRLWMAPELQEAYEKEPLPVDPSWDLYALGLILCYLLCGRLPRRRQYSYQDCIDYRDGVFALLHGEAAQADPAWQKLVSDLQQLLSQVLARNPHQRPTASEFAAALADLLARMGVNVAGRPVPVQPEPFDPLEESAGDLAVAQLLPFIPSTPLGQTIQPVRMADNKAFTGILYRVGRWVGIAFLALLTFSLVLTLLNNQAPGSLAAISGGTQHEVAVGAPTVTATTPAQPVVAATSTLPPPTLASLPTKAPASIPTLALIIPTTPAPPPTLVRFTPTALPTATPTATATPLPPTPTPPPTPTQPLPTPTSRPQPTTLPFATIRLRQPAANGVAGQERVTFVWEATGAPVVDDQCYELVFWDPAKARDKRSPIGASRATSATVNFNKLRDSTDPLLRSLARSPQGFDWGVRFVSCAAPTTILQDVGETRRYTYRL